jgi:hypothetical protein
MGLAQKEGGVYIGDVKTKTKKTVARAKKSEASAPTGPGRQAGPRDKDLETIHSEMTAQPQTQHLEEWVSVDCPFCAETMEVHVTSEQDGQTTYEDCGVCCRPVSLHIQVEDGEFHVEAHRS